MREKTKEELERLEKLEKEEREKFERTMNGDEWAFEFCPDSEWPVRYVNKRLSRWYSD